MSPESLDHPPVTPRWVAPAQADAVRRDAIAIAIATFAVNAPHIREVTKRELLSKYVLVLLTHGTANGKYGTRYRSIGALDIADLEVRLGDMVPAGDDCDPFDRQTHVLLHSGDVGSTEALKQSRGHRLHHLVWIFHPVDFSAMVDHLVSRPSARFNRGLITSLQHSALGDRQAVGEPLVITHDVLGHEHILAGSGSGGVRRALARDAVRRATLGGRGQA